HPTPIVRRCFGFAVVRQGLWLGIHHQAVNKVSLVLRSNSLGGPPCLSGRNCGFVIPLPDSATAGMDTKVVRASSARAICGRRGFNSQTSHSFTRFHPFEFRASSPRLLLEVGGLARPCFISPFLAHGAPGRERAVRPPAGARCGTTSRAAAAKPREN